MGKPCWRRRPLEDCPAEVVEERADVRVLPVFLLHLWRKMRRGLILHDTLSDVRNVLLRKWKLLMLHLSGLARWFTGCFVAAERWLCGLPHCRPQLRSRRAGQAQKQRSPVLTCSTQEKAIKKNNTHDEMGRAALR